MSLYSYIIVRITNSGEVKLFILDEYTCPDFEDKQYPQDPRAWDCEICKHCRLIKRLDHDSEFLEMDEVIHCNKRIVKKE